MVYKVCKGGVRSGNTLRGLHSLRTRRYAGQACIIGHSNLSNQQVDNLLEESAGDGEIKDALRNTEVILSLNKKRRWGLPATVSHMIRAGQFSNSSAMVSVLERHKLKRRANCVGFACSKQTGGKGLSFHSKNPSSVDAGQKKYFSYSLDYVDQEESRRQIKRRIAEELKTLSKEKKLTRKKSVRTVDVFTIDGRKGNNVTNTSPVYNLEVFYPCPQSCSLTFNPKYTDVSMTQNDDGEMEIRSNVRNEKKSQRKHRKRITKSDLAAITKEASSWEEDVQEMWQEVYKDTEEHIDNSQLRAAADKQRQEMMRIEEHFNRDNEWSPSYCLSDSVLGRLVDQAELARAQWNHANIRTRQRRRSGRHGENAENKQKARFQWDGAELKSHIFNAKRDTQNTNLPSRSKSASARGPSGVAEGLLLSSVPVILSTAEVAPHNLREKFGNAYAEADCQPRRFCIDITEDVRNIMPVSRSFISSSETTFVVFISAGVYNDDLETYRVIGNCAGCPESEHISYSMPFGQTTLESVINTFVGNLFDLKEAGHLNFSVENVSCNMHAIAPVYEMMIDKLKVQVDTFFTSNELNRRSKTGNLQEKTGDTKDFTQSLIRLVTENEIDIFCEICYDNINPTQSDSVLGTQMNACGHLFCDACWRAHLRTRLLEGSVHMACPGYQCDTKLGPATLLSLLHVTEVAQILQRACEDEVEICPTSKWCPNPSCGRVLKLSTTLLNRACPEDSPLVDNTCLDVTCACGESWCFNCLAPAHWPACCEQAQVYLRKVRTLKPRDEETVVDPRSHISEPLVLEGRLCPKCRRFIDKNGGCRHMTCKCGHQFCWNCLREFDINHFDCTADTKSMDKFTRIVKIRHLPKPIMNQEDGEQAPQSDKEDQSKKVACRRQKSSMYHRAIQQRVEAGREKEKHTDIEELITKICRATRKDLQFKEEVLLQCGVPKAEIPDYRGGSDTSGDAMTRMTMVESVSRYLKSCQQARHALRHVAEYTYVLLQNCPDSTDKRRAFRVASDLIGFCSFSTSVLHAGGNQDPRAALRRLSDIQAWSSRALDALLATVHRLKN